MERILQWILKLESELDRHDKTLSDDLKTIKEQFQHHEVIRKSKILISYDYSCIFMYLKELMMSLTKDQNQIGDVLVEGNKILKSKKIHLHPQQENEMKEQMKMLNHRWELLRSKSLDRQSM